MRGFIYLPVSITSAGQWGKKNFFPLFVWPDSLFHSTLGVAIKRPKHEEAKPIANTMEIKNQTNKILKSYMKALAIGLAGRGLWARVREMLHCIRDYGTYYDSLDRFLAVIKLVIKGLGIVPRIAG